MKVYVTGKRFILAPVGLALVIGPIYGVAWLLGRVHEINLIFRWVATIGAAGALIILGLGILGVAFDFKKD